MVKNTVEVMARYLGLVDDDLNLQLSSERQV